jgi:hypothetical protein
MLKPQVWAALALLPLHAFACEIRVNSFMVPRDFIPAPVEEALRAKGYTPTVMGVHPRARELHRAWSATNIPQSAKTLEGEAIVNLHGSLLTSSCEKLPRRLPIGPYRYRCRSPRYNFRAFYGGQLISIPDRDDEREIEGDRQVETWLASQTRMYFAQIPTCGELRQRVDVVTAPAAAVDDGGEVSKSPLDETASQEKRAAKQE